MAPGPPCWVLVRKALGSPLVRLLAPRMPAFSRRGRPGDGQNDLVSSYGRSARSACVLEPEQGAVPASPDGERPAAELPSSRISVLLRIRGFYETRAVEGKEARHVWHSCE